MKFLYKYFDKYRRFVPKGLRTTIRKLFDLEDYDEFLAISQNPFANDPPTYLCEDSPILAGILKDRSQYHRHWIAACRELGVSYKLINFDSPNWIEDVKSAGCDVYLVWPEVSSFEWKNMFDERLRIMVEVLNLKIYPSLTELWLYENKRAQHYWLKANNIPTPQTWIFYERDEALDFLRSAQLPLVLKLATGGASSGVYILRSKREAEDFVKRAFGKGISQKRRSSHRAQRGYVYFQEYLPNVKEWRMVRIGDSFFGHGKERVGDFHSGSRRINWDIPDKKAFELLKYVTDLGGFTSMNVDMFETEDGRFLVNELQTVFGTSISGEQMKIDGKPGRYLYVNGDWVFEPGSFCANHMCNLRLEYVIRNIDKA